MVTGSTISFSLPTETACTMMHTAGKILKMAAVPRGTIGTKPVGNGGPPYAKESRLSIVRKTLTISLNQLVQTKNVALNSMR